MVSTNWSNGSINSTNFKGNATFDDEVTRLNSTTVTLDSTTIYLLGFTPGRNMINTLNSTDFTNSSVKSTDFSQPAINSTDFTKGSTVSTNWA